MLTVDDHNGLTELGRRAHAQGQVLEIAVYGGSALMLASNFRVTTQDVDAVAEVDQDLVDRLAQDIGRERGWPHDWLSWRWSHSLTKLNSSNLSQRSILRRAFQVA